VVLTCAMDRAGQAGGAAVRDGGGGDDSARRRYHQMRASATRAMTPVSVGTNLQVFRAQMVCSRTPKLEKPRTAVLIAQGGSRCLETPNSWEPRSGQTL